METINNDILNIYVCGPTVYDHAHLGHARTYVTVDIMNRIMQKIKNEKTKLVMNITDIDDKIIKKAQETNQTWHEVAKTFQISFINSMKKLGVDAPNILISVSEVIPDIITYIQQIINNGFAYVTSDGSVYFDTNAYIRVGYEYDGKIDDDENQYSSEIPNEILKQKKDKQDFALWKGRAKNDIGFVAKFYYDNQLVETFGRPGWHIECSCMIHQTMGQNLNIHFGGIDLKFPHHYNERLQAHAFYHPKFLPKNNESIIKSNWCDQFMHIGHLCVTTRDENNVTIHQKMSKSLKNFTSIDDALSTITPNQMRWMFMKHKWFDSMEYSPDTIEHAKKFDSIISNFFNRVVNYPFDSSNINDLAMDLQLEKVFDSCKLLITRSLIKFDLHAAVTNLSELISCVNQYIDKNKTDGILIKKIYHWILELVQKLGFEYDQKLDTSIAELMKVLISTRTAIRGLTRRKDLSKEIKNELFQILDKERNEELLGIGITLQDTKDSSSWFHT